MELLKRAAVNELDKLLAKGKTKLFLLLTGLLPVIGMPIVLQLQNMFGVTGVGRDQYPIAVLNMMTLFIVPLTVFMNASDMFSGELGDKTIRSMLVRPVSRMKIFASKLLALFAAVAVQLGLAGLVSAGASFFLPAAGSIGQGMAEAALAYAAAALPMFVLCIAAAVLAQGFKNASGALAVLILLYGALKLLEYIFPHVMAFSPTAYTDWHSLWIGGSVSFGKLFTIFNFLAGCGIVMYALGYMAFDNKEV
ncbi:ABC transporter permease [Paenibacillus kobensis]|uniref:ABC transporter permease n=1 Tax=Paenibacillus kobensis TaxID=59841 RepID=UPI000FDBEED9|nr:ABC transporter permease [Paenibacillus kobensis]